MNKIIKLPLKLVFGVASILVVLLVVPFVSAITNSPDFKSFDATYRLSKDDDGRSQLHVKEKIIVEFAQSNSNKGIVRELPRTYENRPLSLELINVTRNGQTEPLYENTILGNFRVISTGTDDYLHGRQEYIIEYSYRDVVRQFDNYQELYWDVNGSGWRFGFDEVSARLIFEDEVIRDAFNGEVACYEGIGSDSLDCLVDIKNGEIAYSSTRRLNPKETITIAAGFRLETFALYRETQTGYIFRWAAALFAYGLSARAIILTIRYRKKGRDHPGRGAIPVEYTPPKDISVITAAALWQKHGVSSKAVVAGLLELAVNKKLKIISEKTSSKGFFSREAYFYKIILTNTSGLATNHKQILSALYGKQPANNQSLDLTKQDHGRASRIHKFLKQEQATLLSLGYRRKVAGIYQPYLVATAAFAIAMGLIVEMTQVGFGLNYEIGRFLSLATTVVTAALVVTLLSNRHRPLTHEGRQLHDYLKGLEQYIKLSEAERLRFAQSPSGAQKQSIDTSDTKQVIRLYESLLPYAVLFGHEKEWYKTLGQYYEEQKQQPVWYSGSTAGFNAAAFSGAMSTITKSASSHSSSSGLSGGSAGGGGGGGGGGAR